MFPHKGLVVPSCLPAVCSYLALTPVPHALKSQEAALSSTPLALQHLGAFTGADAVLQAEDPQKEWRNTGHVVLGSQQINKARWLAILCRTTSNLDEGVKGALKIHNCTELPWCLQCRRSEFDPWLRKIPLEKRNKTTNQKFSCSTLQYSCLGNPMGRESWQLTVHGGHQELDMNERQTLYWTEGGN